jgi:hypothetical protein
VRSVASFQGEAVMAAAAARDVGVVARCSLALR